MIRPIIYLFPLLLVCACSNSKEKAAPVQVSQNNLAVGIGKVVPRGGVSNLASPVGGIVSDILVATGSTVREGDLLLTIDKTDALLRMEEIESRLATQQRSVRAAILLKEQGDTRLLEIGRKLDDARELLAAGAVTGENVRALQHDLELERQNLEKLDNDVRLQEAQLQELAAQRKSRTEELERTSLRAPMDGTVLEVLPQKGEALAQYETYLLLAPDAPLVVKAEIDELFSHRLAVGLPCRVTVPGNIVPSAKGSIIALSPDLKKKSLFSDSGQDFEDRRVREIEIALEGSTHLLIDTKVECIVELP